MVLDELRRNWKATIVGEGGICPCCDRWGKVYGRSINETMAESLRWLHEQSVVHGIGTWIDVPNTAPKNVLRSNQLPTLRWWGLVERRMPEPDSKVKFSGMWRITLKGIDFTTGKILVPRKVFTYNGDPVAFSEDETDFAACFKVSFDYKEVMADSKKSNTVKEVVPAITQ